MHLSALVHPLPYYPEFRDGRAPAFTIGTLALLLADYSHTAVHLEFRLRYLESAESVVLDDPGSGERLGARTRRI